MDTPSKQESPHKLPNINSKFKNTKKVTNKDSDKKNQKTRNNKNFSIIKPELMTKIESLKQTYIIDRQKLNGVEHPKMNSTYSMPQIHSFKYHRTEEHSFDEMQPNKRDTLKVLDYSGKDGFIDRTGENNIKRESW